MNTSAKVRTMIRLQLNTVAGFCILALAACGCASKPAPDVTVAAASDGAVWRPFAADSPWNTKIPPDAKTDPESDMLIASLAATNPLYIAIAEWSVPVYYIERGKTPSKVVYQTYAGQYGRGFEPGTRIPIPEDDPTFMPEKGSGLVSIVDKTRNVAWEMKQAYKRPDGSWFAGFGAVTDLSRSGVAPPWMQAESYNAAASPRASGAPLIAGLIRVEAVKAGRIDHALAFAYPKARTDAFVPPASTALESDAATPFNGTGLPMGARIQLDPSFDVDKAPLSPAGKVIARALQEYGAILVDNAGGTVLYAESGPAQLAEWQGVLDSQALQAVFTAGMMAGNFRVIDTGEVMPGRAKPPE